MTKEVVYDLGLEEQRIDTLAVSTWKDIISAYLRKHAGMLEDTMAYLAKIPLAGYQTL